MLQNEDQSILRCIDQIMCLWRLHHHHGLVDNYFSFGARVINVVCTVSMLRCLFWMGPVNWKIIRNIWPPPPPVSLLGRKISSANCSAISLQRNADGYSFAARSRTARSLMAFSLGALRALGAINVHSFGTLRATSVHSFGNRSERSERKNIAPSILRDRVDRSGKADDMQMTFDSLHCCFSFDFEVWSFHVIISLYILLFGILL